MGPEEARRRFTMARTAVLATVDGTGAPHLVPVCFVVDGQTLWTAVDGKPKRGNQLRRHANIRADPRVSLLVEHWSEDWSRLWWVRADGYAAVVDDLTMLPPVAALLRRKYAQYAEVEIRGPVIEVAIRSWRGWQADPEA